MFKWMVLLGLAIALGIQNYLLKRELGVVERHNQQLVDGEWERSTQRHLVYLDELKEYFDSRPNQWPVLGEISSEFGFRVDPFTGSQTMHYGLDIAAPHGTEVHAPAPGKVVFVGDGGLLGNLVAIQHAREIKTLYGHLSDYFVQEGQWVSRGQKLGAVGNTGRSTASHLHYSVMYKGVHQDPRDYLD